MPFLFFWSTGGSPNTGNVSQATQSVSGIGSAAGGQTDLTAVAAYINSQLVLSDGSIIDAPPAIGGYITPYNANIGCLALVAAGDSTSLTNALNWAKWYVANLNTVEDIYGTTYTVYDWVPNSGGTAAGTPTNPNGTPVNTTTTTTIATGSHVMVVASATNIINGMTLAVGAGASIENVVVTHVSGTSITATFTKSHSGTTTVTSFGYDSADSYAATFLQLIWALWRTGDATIQTWILTQHTNILNIASVIPQVWISARNLTEAFHTYGICFLEDNCEVHTGMVSAAEILTTIFGDTTNAATYQGYANNIINTGLPALWNAAGGYYYYAIADDGTIQATNPATTFYPDAITQLFPIAHGILAPTSARAIALYASFNANWPGWQNHTAPGIDSFPWCIMGYVANLMGDTTSVAEYLSYIETTYQDQSPTFPYEFYDLEAGWYGQLNRALITTGGPGAVTQGAQAVSGSGIFSDSIGSGAVAQATQTVAGIVVASPPIPSGVLQASQTVSGSATLGNATATGAVSQASQMAVGRAFLTLAATGAVAQAAQTATGVANLTFAATGSVSQASQTVSGSTDVGAQGTGAVAQGSQAAGGVASFGHPATGAVSQASQTAAGVAAFNVITNTGAVVQASQAASGSAALHIIATGAVTQATQAASGTASLTISSTGAVAQATQNVNGSSSFTGPSVTGTGSVTQATQAASGTALLTIRNTGAVAQAAQTVSGSAQEVFVARGAVSQAPQSVSGSVASWGAVGAVSQAPQSVSGSVNMGEVLSIRCPISPVLHVLLPIIPPQG